MWVHFIAIGGAAMHNLAMALHLKGYRVTGSDDQIFDPSRSRLSKYGILPEKEGWDAGCISPGMDAVIVGMHARNDNPELSKAKELGLKIFSFPEYIYEQTRDKERVVIGGSHGKTTITAMILHVLHELNIEANYLVGAQLEGYECMVRLADTDEFAVIEGDEYLASPLDPRPKFHLYHPHIALISGIAWDHINVFPTRENYEQQFSEFIDKIGQGGSLIYCEEDEAVVRIAKKARSDIELIPYRTHPHRIELGTTILKTPDGYLPVKIFGAHNLVNLMGALEVCRKMGISDREFYRSIQSFSGASRRLEKIGEKEDGLFFKDFAHAPSKLKATVLAVKNQYPDRKLIACIELHTFSSLNPEFISNYKGSLEVADLGLIYFNPDAARHKKLEPLDPGEVTDAFGKGNLRVFTDSQDLVGTINSEGLTNTNVLIMTSGNFGGIDIDGLRKELGY